VVARGTVAWPNPVPDAAHPVEGDNLKRLDYATPAAPEPLGRWFVRRLIIFVLTLLAIVGMMIAVREVLDLLGIEIIGDHV
jgi:hypothetical protein